MKPIDDIAELEKEIQELKEYIKRMELSHDTYYVNGTYYQDAAELRRLERLLASKKAGERPFPENASEK